MTKIVTRLMASCRLYEFRFVQHFDRRFWCLLTKRLIATELTTVRHPLLYTKWIIRFAYNIINAYQGISRIPKKYENYLKGLQTNAAVQHKFRRIEIWNVFVQIMLWWLKAIKVINNKSGLFIAGAAADKYKNLSVLTGCIRVRIFLIHHLFQHCHSSRDIFQFIFEKKCSSIHCWNLLLLWYTCAAKTRFIGKGS